jgi:UDP-hydrolysing UDP-N-acetyl-D-glucosamine 2-epimerase
MARHVAAVSGSRADFGPLHPLLRGLAGDARFRLSTVVCAVGAADEADRQLAAFAEAGLGVDAIVRPPVEMPGVTDQAGLALSGVGAALDRIRPELVVLLGDRFEIAAAALAVHLLRIPIVHLSGGDETLGSLDDAMRHAISRLADLHLPTNEESAGRLRALGIPAGRIHVVGSTALDDLVALQPIPIDDLATSIGLDLAGRIIAVTYHPATQADEAPADTMHALLAAVRDAAPDAAVIITGSNADEGGSAIDAVAERISAQDDRMVLVPSLGPHRYWSLLHHADAVVGNSSSALIEAPVLGVPVVDVGERQRSRRRAPSCIHADARREAIGDALRAALTRERTPEASPYGDGRAVPRTLEVLAAIGDPRTLLEGRPLLPVEEPAR